jgi:hypothetical protein
MPCIRTIERADRAIYLDFEGRIDEAPVLAGILRVGPEGTDFRQVVLDPRFAPAAEAKGLAITTIEELVEELVVEAESLDGPIVGWSHHEIEVVQSYSPMLAERFHRHYTDAKAAAKSAPRKSGVTLPDLWGTESGHALGRYQRHIGYAVPYVHRSGSTGKRLLMVVRALERRGQWASLTSIQKGYWSNLLEHNRHDCYGTYEVARWATRDLALQPAAEAS